MNSRIGALLAASALIALVSGCKGAGASREAAAPPSAALASTSASTPVMAEWTMIEPGGETLCATGTPFRFHVREGDPARVLLFLNGGGACWSGDLCDLPTEPTPYTPFSEMDANNPARLKGVFGAEPPPNPFTGWTQVFVPYCTGDSHLGARDVTYTTTAGTETVIHHRGKANVQAALDWLYANRPEAERIFVSGGSAGAIASPYYAGVVADHYPQADIAQLADGSGAYRAAGIAGVLEAWGAFDDAPDWPELSTIDRSMATTEDFFRVIAARYPQIRLARFDNVDDEVQQGFLTLLGSGEPVRALLAANNADLARDIPSIRTFSAKGKAHTSLRFDVFYSNEIGGVKLSDWVADLAEGREVPTLSCETDASCD